MKHYYAIFKKTSEAVEVEFPDLEGCVTFGKDGEEALENAEDVLSAWLSHAEQQDIKEPSKHDDLIHLSKNLVPIGVNEKIIDFYTELKRFKVIFPKKTLESIDKAIKKIGLKRSIFLQKAAEEYLHSHG